MAAPLGCLENCLPDLVSLRFLAEEAAYCEDDIDLIAASGRYNLSEDFVLGADLGYALGLSPSGNDGGFYYRPMLGYNLSEKMMVTASYSTVSVSNGGGNWGSFGVGLMFGL